MTQKQKKTRKIAKSPARTQSQLIADDGFNWQYQNYLTVLDEYEKQGMPTKEVKELYSKFIPLFREKPGKFSFFIDGIRKNLHGNSNDLLACICEWIDELTNIFHNEVMAPFESHQKSVNAQEGKKINTQGRLDVFSEIALTFEKEKRQQEENEEKYGVAKITGTVIEYWNSNKEKCIQLGWNNPSSLLRAYQEHQNPTKHKEFVLPITNRFPPDQITTVK